MMSVIIIVFCESSLFAPAVRVLMQFTKFGQTGLAISRIILGTGTFGNKQMKKRRIECSISGPGKE
jgi:hypothetical protein